MFACSFVFCFSSSKGQIKESSKHSEIAEFNNPSNSFNSESVNSSVLILFPYIKFRHLDRILF